MEVVKAQKSYIKRCNNCGSVLRFYRTDVKTGLLRVYNRIKCPICGKHIDLPGSLLWYEEGRGEIL